MYYTNGLPICTLSELYNEYESGHIYRITHIYKMDSGFDISAILATDDFCVTIPEIVTSVDSFLNDNEIIDIINSGKIGFSISTYKMEYNPVTYYTIVWHDCESGCELYGKKDFRLVMNGVAYVYDALSAATPYLI